MVTEYASSLLGSPDLSYTHGSTGARSTHKPFLLILDAAYNNHLFSDITLLTDTMPLSDLPMPLQRDFILVTNPFLKFT